MLKQIITPAETENIKKIFSGCKNVVICTHTSPDGDAIGSSLGLYHYLKSLGKTPTVIVPNYFPDFLRWMEGADKIIQYDRNRVLSKNIINMADLICCLDFNAMDRIDDLATPIRYSNAKKVMIDHHLNPEKFCDITISHPEASSTCELLFRILTSIGGTDRIKRAGAECFYAGMCTDTGGFTYNSNDPDIFVIISELMRKGIDKDLIYRKIYNKRSARKEIKQNQEDITENVNTILSDIVAEGVISARFDSHIPNYIYDIEDLAIVEELLATLDGATYEVCERPKEPWGSIEAIYITTHENEYHIGVIENSAFRISANGEGEYYTCSHKDNFLNKLLELQDR